MRTREKRTAVRLSARMRAGDGWSDVQIHNASPRGLLLSAAAAPGPGGYIEVRRDTVVIVARVVWRSGDKVGVRTQDRIDLKALIAPRRTSPPVAGPERVERRQATRRDAPDRSRHLARMLQFGGLLAGIGVAAAAIFGAVSGALAPLRAIETSLVGS